MIYQRVAGRTLAVPAPSEALRTALSVLASWLTTALLSVTGLFVFGLGWAAVSTVGGDGPAGTANDVVDVP